MRSRASPCVSLFPYATLFRSLQEKWNQWLAEEHDDTAAMAKAWGARAASFGREMLTALDSSAVTHDDAGWVLERHSGAQAQASVNAKDRTGARIKVTESGTEGWHVHLEQLGLNVADG